MAVWKKSFTYSFRYFINFLFSKRFSLKNKAFGAIGALLMPDPVPRPTGNADSLIWLEFLHKLNYLRMLSCNNPEPKTYNL